MKTTKKFIMMILAAIMLFSVIAVGAQAASVDFVQANYGYMVPTDAKFTKSISTVKLYGDYDYINFLIESKSNDVYFFYEIYSDKAMTKLVGGGSTYCADSGSYVFSPAIKLKGNFKSDKTYYCATYAAKTEDGENVKVSEKSVKSFKLKVTLKPKFKQKVVILKSVKNTVNGPTISWKKLSNGTKKYVVYRKGITDAKWKKIATVKGDTYSYTDKSIKDKNVTYMYTVKGCDKNGTKTRCQYNGLLALYAKAPKVTAVNVTTDNKIEIKWKSSSPTATYRIYRSENNGKYKLVAKNITGTTYYDDTAKNSGSRYKYAVKAAIPTEYGTAVSSYKATKNRTFLAAPELNPVVVTDNGLSISWSSVNGATGYTVYRKILDEKAEFTELAKLDANTLAFTDTTANAESAFSYTVRATTEKVNGSYNSKGVEYFTLSQPEVKIKFTDTAVQIEWDDIAYAEKYEIMKRNSDGTWSVMTETDYLSFSFYASEYEKMQISVRAVRGDFRSAFNENLDVITLYPDNSIGIGIFTDYSIIRWMDVGADSYNLYKKETIKENAEFELIYSGKENIFKDTNVEFDLEYTYLLKGVWDGVEQNYRTPKMCYSKYSVDKYITIKDSYQLYEAEHPLNLMSFPGYYFDIEKKIVPEDNSLFVRLYAISESGEYIFTGHEDKFLNDGSFKFLNNVPTFSFVVSDYRGCSPMDNCIVNILPEKCEGLNIEYQINSNGAKLSWTADKDAEKYIVQDIGHTDSLCETIAEVQADGSSSYSVDVQESKYAYITGYSNYRIISVHKNGNMTASYIWDKIRF